MWLLQYFIPDSIRADFIDLVATDRKKNDKQERKLTKHVRVVSYLLDTYATYDFITETEAGIINLT